ncbi:WhiB family transcriptional regulator [Streptomyces sp. NPDC006458]|uniref:WhiB family transcriptional regulator n=1 Tax=Streptomyces sp. NPDC006458 TaxID=3154302 RepID=UPI0033ACADDE
MTNAARDAADWRLRAACRGQDTDHWFDAKGSHHATAQQVCNGCPVRAECLYDVLTTEPPHHRYGLWGGLNGDQRRSIPTLPASTAAALAALREHLAVAHPPAERTEPPMSQPIPTAPPSLADADVRLRAAERLPVGQLLKWGATHPDAHVRDQAMRAQDALVGLRQRHAADAELTAITDEAANLEKRLAELRAREAELAPAKAKKKRAVTRDYEPRTVRAWAAETGIDCPRVGQIPRPVLDAWRATTGQASASPS